MLSKDIREYISKLKNRFAEITSIWLIGSRANGTETEKSDWDFLVFSKSSIFEQVHNESVFHKEHIDLLLVGLKGEFKKPFGEPKRGSLEKWKWHQLSEDQAEYEGCKWISDIESELEGLDDLGQIVYQSLNAYRV